MLPSHRQDMWKRRISEKKEESMVHSMGTNADMTTETRHPPLRPSFLPPIRPKNSMDMNKGDSMNVNTKHGMNDTVTDIALGSPFPHQRYTSPLVVPTDSILSVTKNTERKNTRDWSADFTKRNGNNCSNGRHTKRSLATMLNTNSTDPIGGSNMLPRKKKSARKETTRLQNHANHNQDNQVAINKKTINGRLDDSVPIPIEKSILPLPSSSSSSSSLSSPVEIKKECDDTGERFLMRQQTISSITSITASPSVTEKGDTLSPLSPPVYSLKSRPTKKHTIEKPAKKLRHQTTPIVSEAIERIPIESGAKDKHREKRPPSAEPIPKKYRATRTRIPDPNLFPFSDRQEKITCRTDGLFLRDVRPETIERITYDGTDGSDRINLDDGSGEIDDENGLNNGKNQNIPDTGGLDHNSDINDTIDNNTAGWDHVYGFAGSFASRLGVFATNGTLPIFGRDSTETDLSLRNGLPRSDKNPDKDGKTDDAREQSITESGSGTTRIANDDHSGNDSNNNIRPKEAPSYVDDSGCAPWLLRPGTRRHRRWYDSASAPPASDPVVARLSRAMTYARMSRLSDSLIRGPDVMVRHLLEPWDWFLRVQMPAILKETPRFEVESTLTGRRCVCDIGDVHVRPPSVKESDGTIRPVMWAECVLRGLTYAITVEIDVTTTYYDTISNKETSRHEFGEVLVGSIPNPVRGTGCAQERGVGAVGGGVMADTDPMCPGGFFVVGGNEKVIVTQERMRTNRALVFRERQPSRWAFRCEVRSCLEQRVRSTSTLILLIGGIAPGEKPEMRVRLPFIRKFELPLLWLFALIGLNDRRSVADSVLGWCSRDPITGHIADPPFEALLERVLDAHDPFPSRWTRDDMLDEVGRLDKEGAPTREKRIRDVEHVLRGEFLPHVGPDPCARASYVGYCVHEILLRALGRLPPHDKDHYASKGVDSLGTLFAQLLRPNWRATFANAKKEAKRALDRGALVDPECCFRDLRVTSSFKYALSTGRWGTKKGASPHTGFAQMHTRMNLAASLSSLRKLSHHVNKDGRLSGPRYLDPSAVGMTCKNETPEGPHCGTSKNLALGARITVGCDSRLWISALDAAGAHEAGWLPFNLPVPNDSVPWSQVFAVRYDVGPPGQVVSSDPPETQVFSANSPRDIETGRATVGGNNLAGIVGEQNAKKVVPICLGVSRLRAVLTTVFVHGCPWGFVRSDLAPHLVHRLRHMRRRNAMVPRTAAIWHTPAERRIDLSAEPGSIVRPLVPLCEAHRLSDFLEGCGKNGNEGERSSSWTVLEKEGLVDWVGKEEERTLRVAGRPCELLAGFDIARGEVSTPIPGSGCVTGYDADAIEVAQRVDLQPFTHVEIDPMLLLGVCTAKIPFSNRNQTPRNTYGATMAKQAQPGPSMSERHDSAQAYELMYAQTPMVQTRLERSLLGHQPTGSNVMLAIMCLDGYNVEDAVIISADEVDRGRFLNATHHTYREEERVRAADAARIERPPPKSTRGLRAANYATLGPRGYAEPGTEVAGGDALIGKTAAAEEVVAKGKRKRPPRAGSPAAAAAAIAAARAVAAGVAGAPGPVPAPLPPTAEGDLTGNAQTVSVPRDTSLILRPGSEPAVVESVIETTNREGAKMVRSKTRSTRRAELGDKFCSRHAQKGVNGNLVRGEDLPSIVGGPNAGCSPTIIMNPHGVPSRMTGGHQMEILAAKAGACSGMLIDGTAYGEQSVQALEDVLRRRGMRPNGTELFIHPHTGKMLRCPVYYGPALYECLKHVASEKMHARSTGPVKVLIRQPVEGRTKGGGFRFGNMECDTLVSHGASALHYDRIAAHSDPYLSHVCGTCGLIAIPGSDSQPAHCRVCRSFDNIHVIRIPYAAQLMTQELVSALLALRFEIEPADFPLPPPLPDCAKIQVSGNDHSDNDEKDAMVDSVGDTAMIKKNFDYNDNDNNNASCVKQEAIRSSLVSHDTGEPYVPEFVFSEEQLRGLSVDHHRATVEDRRDLDESWWKQFM